MESELIDLEKKFQHHYSLVRKHSHYLWDFYFGNNGLDNETIDVTSFWVREDLEKMYRIACVYMETLGLNEFLKEFKTKYSEIVLNISEATKIECYPLYDGDTEEEMYLIHEWQNFLSPFKLFKIDKKEDELIKLHQILENTNEILKITNTVVKNEHSINKTIRNFLDLYYGNVVQYSESLFRHKFKSYQPDVILSDEGISIEYKLIRTEKDIGIKLDELLIDANRYVGNHRNKSCIAVFCLSKKITTTKKQIKEDWRKMMFPKSWSFIVISDVEINC
ncbi:hypothetical protein MC378_13760 [Polaribacter sp. MSW13]|uniref:Uncharacterized protein n=1 Tax=Polaribacter marinus TaxID=2916838 RepID=A0A9X1VP93_9FLAO|nr:hypothetical protein [Polaribacter marinus]MCI2230239.1 hypothetical protein [Polaribacter marinus]